VQRRLVLVRHAQAAHAAADADRPLTDQGEEQAAAIGRWLQDAGLVPDRVVVSPALRAIRTWERAAAQLATPPAPVVDERIYDNTVEELLGVIGETPADGGTVAVVGHNPSIGVLASLLDDGEGSPSARRDLQAGFPTGAVAVFTLGTAFDALAPGSATLTALAVPRD
jgi:phosphohistidine phosphatase